MATKRRNSVSMKSRVPSSKATSKTKIKAKIKTTPKIRLFRGIDACLTLAGAVAKDGRHVTEKDLGIVRKAVILEQGGRVVWVGKEAGLSKGRVAELTAGRSGAVEEVDVGGRCVLPAFVESHTHLVFAGQRANEFELRNRGVTYQEIAKKGGGILATVRPTRAMSVDDLAGLAQERANAFVRQGAATIECKSGYALTTSGEMKMLAAAGRIEGPRVVRTYLGPHAVPPEENSAAAYIETVIEKGLPRVRREGLATRADIFVENGYFSEELARTYLEAARAHGFDLVVHADQLSRSGGARLAVEFGARSAEHLIKINDTDVCALAASQTTCVLLPAADLYLRCDYPPARSLLQAGARVAIATDFNPGTSPTQSLSLVGVLSRLEMKMSLPETLVAYTLGGAFALGLGGEIGAILPGRYCDLTALEVDWTDLFYSIGDMPVHRVWREGRSLL